MRMYASMMRDLARSHNYIKHLIIAKDNELDPIEIGLRKQIQGHRMSPISQRKANQETSASQEDGSVSAGLDKVPKSDSQ